MKYNIMKVLCMFDLPVDTEKERYNRKLGYDELIEMLQNVIHKIGGKGKLVSISDLVILKLINESLAINECITKSPVEQEISFLLT